MDYEFVRWRRRELLAEIARNTHETRAEIAALKEQVMATIEQFEAVVTQINAGLDGISADIAALKDQIAGMGLAGAQEEALLASLTAIADRVTAIDTSTP